jgi:hypothetical protein
MSEYSNSSILTLNETAALTVFFESFESDIFLDTATELISSEETTVFNFYVQAKTYGNKVNYLELEITFIPYSSI